LRALCITRDLFHAKATILLWPSDNLIKLLPCDVELARANMNNTSVELVYDSDIQLFISLALTTRCLTRLQILCLTDLITADFDLSELQLDHLDQLPGAAASLPFFFCIGNTHTLGLLQMLKCLLVPSDHAFGLSKIHQNIVSCLWCQLTLLTQTPTNCFFLSRTAVDGFLRVIGGRCSSIVDVKQLLPVVNALDEIVCDEIHVAQVLVRILDEQGMLTFDFLPDLELEFVVAFLTLWQLLVFDGK